MGLDFQQIFSQALKIFIYAGLPGALGGAVAFLLAFRNGQIKNNQHIRKFSIDIFSGAVTASFIAIIIPNKIPLASTAFIIGIGWASIVNFFKTKVTTIINSVLKIVSEENKEIRKDAFK